MVFFDLKAIAPRITDTALERLCADNPDARFETNAKGYLLAMSPTGSESGRKNVKLVFQVELWNVKNDLGVTFDSSTGFKLSNGAVRSPDVTWIGLARWNELTSEQQEKFAPIDPDFVIELLSPTDDLNQLQQKMKEYMDCGVKLGWLIDPEEKRVEIYRQGKDKEVLNNPQTLSGEEILLNFTLDLATIF
ncbi:MAG: Uma2 family endonuclease [Waterburya sp.]